MVNISAVNVNKIQGIKAIRDITGLDLRTCKAVIERICSDENVIQVVAYTSCSLGEQHLLTLDLDGAVKANHFGHDDGAVKAND